MCIMGTGLSRRRKMKMGQPKCPLCSNELSKDGNRKYYHCEACAKSFTDEGLDDLRLSKVLQAFKQLEYDCNGYVRAIVPLRIKELRKALEEYCGGEIAEFN